MTDLIHIRRAMRRSLTVATAFLALCFAANPLAGAAADATPPAPITVSSGTQYQLIGVYDLARLNHIFGAELQDFMKGSPLPGGFAGSFPPARYAVRLYKVTYASVVPELNNRPTRASGLVAVPESGQTVMPMVAYQHGTVFDQNQVPSRPDQSMETRIMIARFASQGYIVSAADYFGRGDSALPDSYFVEGSAQQANEDMLFATKAVLKSLGIVNNQLFLSGWSQGGWTTMAFLHRLVADGIPVTATALASAPVDVSLSLNRWLNNPQAIDAVYMPGVVTLQLEAYAAYHEVPGFDEFAIQPAYVQAARDLYAGKIDFTTFYARTPHTLKEFTRAEFRAAVATGVGVYWSTIDATQDYRWRFVSPLRNWYGGSDEVTPLAIAMLPQETQALLGGAETMAVDAGPKADHRAVFVRSVLDSKPWFDSLLTK